MGLFNGLEGAKDLAYKMWVYINEELLLKGKTDTDDVLGCPEAEMSLIYQVEKAHREWELARSFFEEAQDPDLIDHAIYALEAAERKYIYLLKLAQKENQIDDSLYPTTDHR